MTTTQPRCPSARRRGYTLVELLVAMGTATVLLVGMASTIAVATSVLKEDDPGHDRADAMEVLATVTAELGRAKAFTERTSHAVTAVVPDRDGDGWPDTIRYAWSGTPGDPLTVSVNGGTAGNLVEDVQQFDLAYVIGSTPAPSFALNEGFLHNFPNSQDHIKDVQIATRVELLDPGTIQSVTAYVGGDQKDFRVAVYTDAAGEPGDLVVESDKVASGDAMQWVTAPVVPTWVPAGHYWLALSLEVDKQTYWFSADGELRITDHDAENDGYLASWGTSTTSLAHRMSIYATYLPD